MSLSLSWTAIDNSRSSFLCISSVFLCFWKTEYWQLWRARLISLLGQLCPDQFKPTKLLNPTLRHPTSGLPVAISQEEAVHWEQSNTRRSQHTMVGLNRSPLLLSSLSSNFRKPLLISESGIQLKHSPWSDWCCFIKWTIYTCWAACGLDSTHW